VPTPDKAAGGWSGTLFADGQRVIVDSSSQVMLRPNKGEKKQAKQDKLIISTGLLF